MTMTETPVHGDVLNPVDVERKIEETKSRIAAGVKVVTDREKQVRAKKRAFDEAWAYAIKGTEGPEYLRKADATLATMQEREEADNAEIAFKYASRQADALDKELFAWQAILKSVVAMYNATGVRG